MRTFVRLREMLSSHEELRRKIAAMEKRYDARFQAVFRNDSGDAGNANSGKENDWISRPNRVAGKVWRNLADVSVTGRKQVIYKHKAVTEKVEKTGQFSYTVFVVDSQKIPTN